MIDKNGIKVYNESINKNGVSRIGGNMAKHGKGYLNLGLPWILNLILAIIPVTSWILGGITRITRGHWIMGLLQLLLIGEIVFWIVDIVTVALSGDLRIFA